MILSIDSGSNEFGWCAVRRAGARAAYVIGGSAPATRTGFLAVVDIARRVRGEIEALYIEAPEGFVHQPFRGPHLLTTSELVGGVRWESERLGICVERRTAGWWRKALVGQASSPKKGLMDRLVKDAVSLNAIDWPQVSNVHMRDAMGLGIVACWEMAKGRAA